jgi:mandelamide amidase
MVISVTDVLQGYKGAAAERETLLAQLNKGTAVSATTYRAALVHRRPALKRVFTTYLKINRLAALVYPTTPAPALQLKGPENGHVELASSPGTLVDASTLYSRNTKAASAAGLPALSVPIGLTKPVPGAPTKSPGSERLPVGLELVGAPGDDERLLALGRALQKLVPAIPDPVTMAIWSEGVSHV